MKSVHFAEGETLFLSVIGNSYLRGWLRSTTLAINCFHITYSLKLYGK